MNNDFKVEDFIISDDTSKQKQLRKNKRTNKVFVVVTIVIVATILGMVLFVIINARIFDAKYENSPEHQRIQEAMERAELSRKESQDRLAYLRGEIETYTTYERTLEEKQEEYAYYMKMLEPLLKIKNPDIAEQAQIVALIDLINDLGLTHINYPNYR